MKTNEVPETYPMQFRDKIDEYLWKEHHIIGGCCSSIEEMKYSVAREVAEKLTDAFIEKACEWLDGIIYDYIKLEHSNVDTFLNVDNEKFIKDFKKAMKQ